MCWHKMKDNKFEGISKMVSERVAGIAKSISSENKGQQPFGVPKSEPVDRVYVYDKLTDANKLALIQKHGLEAYKAFEADVQKIKNNRGII